MTRAHRHLTIIPSHPVIEGVIMVLCLVVLACVGIVWIDGDIFTENISLWGSWAAFIGAATPMSVGIISIRAPLSMMHRSIYGMLGWTAIFAMASLLTAICFLIAPEQSVAWSWHIHLLGDAGLCFMLTTAALMLAWPVHHLAPWYAAARSLRRWVMRVWMPASLTVSRLPPTASSLTIATSIVHMMIMQLAVWHVPLFATIISAFLCVSSVVLIHRLSMVHRSSSQSLWSLYRLERRGRYRQTALWDATIVMLGMASTITASMITGQMHVFVMAAYVLRMSMHYAMMRAISRRHGSLKTVVPTPVPGA